jgi:phage portal protein BeeE
MGIASLILDLASGAIESAVARNQGDTIKELKRLVAVWQKRAVEWEAQYYRLVTESNEVTMSLEEQTKKVEKCRRERDDYYQRLVAAKLGPDKLDEIDDIYPSEEADHDE